MRLFYAAGPGDIIETFEHWRRGEPDPSQVAVTYSSQFYDLCERLDVQAMAVAWPGGEARRVEEGRFIVEHRPRPVPGRGVGGWRYHAGMVRYLRGLLASARGFGADVLVVSWERHAFVFRSAMGGNVAVIPSVHNTLWTPGGPRGSVQRLLLSLNRGLFERAAANLVVSPQIAGQIAHLTRNKVATARGFVPGYQRDSFADMPPPGPTAVDAGEPFRVMYAGRIERDKGVFDLLEVAVRLATRGSSMRRIEFDVCGDGSALPELRAAAAGAGVESHFQLHGHCSRPRMRELYGRCHAVVVPTRTQFSEGFNKVVAEAVLAGRPVVTSSACPAVEDVREAVVESPPDDINGYVRAIAGLADDPGFYAVKQAACEGLAEKFYDPSRFWGVTLERVLRAL